MPCVRAFVGEHDSLLGVVEQFDETAGHHDVAAASGQGERERMGVIGDLDRARMRVAESAVDSEDVQGA